MKKKRQKLDPTLLLVGLLALAIQAAPASAYKIFLKDGTSMSAQERYEVRGDKAWFTLQSGSLTSIRFGDIDVTRTDEYNRKHGYDAALVLQDKIIGTTVAETTEPTLQDLIRTRRSSEGTTRRPAATDSESELRQTPAGYDDLTALIRYPLASTDIQAGTLRILRNLDVRRVRAYKGSRPDRILVEVVTDSKGAVLRALEAACKALLQIRARYEEITAIELLMQTSSRERAGQFLLTPNNAPLLAEGRLTAIDFFVEHVQF